VSDDIFPGSIEYYPSEKHYYPEVPNMDFREKACVMSAADINRVLARMATQIVENNPDLSDVWLVGIRRRGVPLAERLA